MSEDDGDPEVPTKVARLALRAELLEDLGAAFRSAAVVYRVGHHREDISGILSTLADKMDLRAKALLEAVEMTR